MRPESAVLAIHNDENEPSHGPWKALRRYHIITRESKKAAANSHGRRWISVELSDGVIDQTLVEDTSAMLTRQYWVVMKEGNTKRRIEVEIHKTLSLVTGTSEGMMAVDSSPGCGNGGYTIDGGTALGMYLYSSQATTHCVDLQHTL